LNENFSLYSGENADSIHV